MYRENALKAKIRRGEPALGCWLFMGSPVIAESLAFAGFDGLIIDHEHAPGGLETAVHQMRAINTTPTTRSESSSSADTVSRQTAMTWDCCETVPWPPLRRAPPNDGRSNKPLNTIRDRKQ